MRCICRTSVSLAAVAVAALVIFFLLFVINLLGVFLFLFLFFFTNPPRVSLTAERDRPLTRISFHPSRRGYARDVLTI